MKIYLIRHAEPDWSMVTEDRPHIEILCPLSEKGILQATQLASDERLDNAEIILSSPYTRALQTAAILSKEMQLPLQVEYDLREWSPKYRPNSGKESFIEAFKEDLKKYSNDPIRPVQNGVETIERVRFRAREVLQRYSSCSKVIAVCHGVIIESLTDGQKAKYAEIVEISEPNLT